MKHHSLIAKILTTLTVVVFFNFLALTIEPALGKSDLAEIGPTCRWYSGLANRPLGFAVKDIDYYGSLYSKLGKYAVFFGPKGKIVNTATSKSLDLVQCFSYKLEIKNFSADEKTFACVEDTFIRIYNLEKQSVASFAISPSYQNHLNISPNHQYIFDAKNDFPQKATLINTQTGKKTVLRSAEQDNNSTISQLSAFSPDSQKLAVVEADSSNSNHKKFVKIYNNNNPTQKPIAIDVCQSQPKNQCQYIQSINYSKDGTQLYVSLAYGTVLVYSGNDWAKPKLITPKNTANLALADDSRFTVLPGTNLAALNIGNKKFDTIKYLYKNLNSGQETFSDGCGQPDADLSKNVGVNANIENHSTTPWIVTQKSYYDYYLFDPTSFRCVKLATNINTIHQNPPRVVIAADNSKATFVGWFGSNYNDTRKMVAVVDLKTGSRTNANQTGDLDRCHVVNIEGNSIICNTTTKGQLVVQDLPICSTKELKLVANKASLDCANCQGAAATKVFDPNNLFSSSKLALEAACSNDFNEANWQTLTPTPTKRDASITVEVAENFLQRFQKIGGFDPQKHLAVLILLIENGYGEKHSNLMLGALQNVYFSSPKLYQELLNDYPSLNNLKFSKDFKNSCRTAADHKKLAATINDWLPNGAKYNQSWNDFKQYSQLFANYVTQTKPSDQETLVDRWGQYWADLAADSPEFHGVFLSKLYKFTSAYVNKTIFNQDSPPLTDITLVREANQFQPILLAHEPIDGDNSSSTKFGFYAKVLPAITLDKIKNFKDSFKQTVSWTQNKQKFSAELNFKSLFKNIKSIIPGGTAPKYNELWANKTLTGLIITGANFGSANGTSTLDEYKNYLIDQDFTIAETTSLIKDVKKFIFEKIENGELDYFIKEAHSDGDEKNLFRLFTMGNLLVATKSLAKGRKEVVYLIYPPSADQINSLKINSDLISNSAFGSSVQKREANHHGQLVYFNTSCWSKTKAIHEIENASSSILLDIPTTQTTKAFENEPQNAEYQLFTAFRQGKSYHGIREALSKNSDYKNNTGNRFIFPDEFEYDQAITRVIKNPIHSTVKIKTGDGKNYSIEEHQGL